jgi:hypothetical protein
MLLVDDGRQPDIAGGRPPRGRAIDHRLRHRRQAGLRVAGAAAMEPAVADGRRERRDRHPVDRHRVHVGLEDDLPRPVGAGQHGDHVVAAGQHGLRARFDPVTAEEVAQKPGHARLAGAAVGGIHAVDAHEVREQVDHGRHRTLPRLRVRDAFRTRTRG